MDMVLQMWRFLGARRKFWLLPIIIVTVLIGGLLAFSFLIVRSIDPRLVAAMRSADCLAVGDTSVELDATASDELGQLIVSMKAMVGYLRHSADLARRIAEGDLTVEIEPRSKADVLGNSLKAMVDSLRGMVGRSLIEAADQRNLHGALDGVVVSGTGREDLTEQVLL